MMGMEPAYTQRLQFDVSQGDRGDPDESSITEAMKNRIKDELEGTVAGEEE